MHNFKIDVARVTLNTTTGSQDLTISGFGMTPKAAILVVTGAVGSGDQSAIDEKHSIGFTDGTDAAAHGATSQDGVTTMVTDRLGSDGQIIRVPAVGGGTDVTASLTSMIANGIRVNITTHASGNAYEAMLILIGGAEVNAKCDVIDPKTTQSQYTGCNFRPDVLFFSGHGKAFDNNQATQNIATFGVATDKNGSIEMASIAMGSNDGSSESLKAGVSSTEKIYGQAFPSADYWSMVVDEFNARGFKFTATAENASPTGDELAMLAIEIGNAPVKFGTFETPTATGTYDRHLGMLPQFVFGTQSSFDEHNVLKDSSSYASTWGLFAASERRQVATGFYDVHNTADSHACSSIRSQIGGYYSEYSAAWFFEATLDHFHSKGVRVTYDGSVSATPRACWMIGFGYSDFLSSTATSSQSSFSSISLTSLTSTRSWSSWSSVTSLSSTRSWTSSATDRYWIGGTNTDWNVKENWAYESGGAGGAPVPTVLDDVYFDGNGNQNCVLSGNATCASLTVCRGFRSYVDLNVFDLTVAGDVTLSFSPGGYWDWGDTGAECTIGGDLDCSDYDGETWVYNDGGTVTFTGTGKTWTANSKTNYLSTFTVSGSLTVAGVSQIRHYGHLTIDEGATLTLGMGGGALWLGYGSADVNGTLTSDSSEAYYLYNSPGELVTLGPNCNFAPHTALWRASIGGILQPGTYNCRMLLYTQTGSPATCVFGAGDFVFNLDVYWDADAELTVDCATNNPNIEFREDVYETFGGGGSLVWNKGTGTITFAGATDQNVEFDSQTLENVVVDKSAGTLTLTGNLTCESFETLSGNSGNVDLATFDLTCNDLILDGSGDWDYGSGSHTISGDLNSVNLSGTYEDGASTVTLDGTNNTFAHGGGDAFRNLVIDGMIAIKAGSDTSVLGTLTVNLGATLTLSSKYLVVYGGGACNGTIEGTNKIYLYLSGGNFTLGGSSDMNIETYYRPDGFSIGPGNWNAAVRFYNNGSTRTATMLAGTYTFNSAVYFYITGSGDIAVDNSANPDFVFKSDVTRIGSGGGGLTWTKGTGTITWDGPNSDDVDMENVALEDVTIDKSAGNFDVINSGFQCNSLTVAATNAADIDFNVYDLTCGDFTLAGTGVFDCGTGTTFTISGDMNLANNLGTWNYETSKIILTGTAKTLTMATSNSNKTRFYEVQVSGTYTVTGAVDYFVTYSHFTVDLAGSATLSGSRSAIHYQNVTVNGTYDAVSTNGVYLYMGTAYSCTVGGSGSFSPGNIYYRSGNYDGTLNAGTYSPTDNFYFWNSNDSAEKTATLQAGTYVFDCDVRWKCDGTYDVKVDASVNNPDIQFTGGVVLDYSSTGKLVWTKGSGTITMTGTGDKFFVFDSVNEVEDVVINRSAGYIKMFGDWNCKSFYVHPSNAGSVYLNTNTLTVSGDVTWFGTGNAYWESGGIACGGDFTTASFNGNWNHDTGTLNMTGTSKTITTSNQGYKFWNVTISGTITLALASYGVNIYGDLDVQGTLTHSSNQYLTIMPGGTCQVSGTLQSTGSGLFRISTTGRITSMTGSFSVGFLYLSTTTSTVESLAPAEYTAPETRIFSSAATGQGTRFAAGTTKFVGDLKFQPDGAGDVVEIDAATNDPDIEITGDVTVAGSGSLSWSKGTGTITLDGGDSQDIDFGGQPLENFSVHKSGGTVTFSNTLDVDSFAMPAGNAGPVDFSDQDVDVGGDFDLVNGSGNLSCGSGTVTVAGSMDASTYWASFLPETSTFVFTGATKTISLAGGSSFYRLTIQGSTTQNSTFTVSQSLQVDVGATHTLSGSNIVICSKYAAINGTLDGTGKLYYYGDATSSLSVGASGSVAPDYVYFRCGDFDSVLEPGTYEPGTFYFWDGGGGAKTFEFQSGTYVFDCTVKWKTDAATDLNISCVNNPDIEFKGSVDTEYNTTGVMNWTAGSGTVTFNGSANQSIIFGGHNTIDDAVIDKPSGLLTVDDDMGCASLTGDDGDCDLNGQVVTVGGNVDFNGDTGFRLWNGVDADQSNALIDFGGDIDIRGQHPTQFAVKGLDFINYAGSSSYVEYATVTDSIRTGTGNDIDAATGPGNIDNGGNAGWEFTEVTSSSSSVSSTRSWTSASTSSSSSSTSETSTRSWTSLSTTSASGSSFSSSSVTSWSSTTLSSASSTQSWTSMSASSSMTSTRSWSSISSSTGDPTRYWVGSVNDDWHVSGNWSQWSGGPGGASVPAVTNPVVFDGNGNRPCNVTANAVCASLTIDTTYTKKLDFASANVSIAGNATFSNGSGGEMDFGSGTHTVGGNWDTTGFGGTWVRASSSLIFNGTGTLSVASAASALGAVTISGNYTRSGDSNIFYVNDDFTLTAAGSLDLAERVIIGSGTHSVDGAITFSDTTYISFNGGTVTFGATASVTGTSSRNVYFYGSTHLEPVPDGVFSGVTVNLRGVAASQQFTFDAGDYYFNSRVVISTNSGGTLTFNNNSNNPDIYFGSDVNWNESGAITWNAGSGTVTFNGAANQDVEFKNETIEDVSVDKSGGSLTLTNDFECESFTVEATNAADVDLNDYDLTTGDVTIAGSGDISLGAGTLTCSGNWDSTSLTGTWTRETSTIEFTGAGTTIDTNNATRYNSTLTFSGSHSLNSISGGTIWEGRTAVNFSAGASLSVASGLFLGISNAVGSVGAGASITGAGKIRLEGTGAYLSAMAGSITCAGIWLDQNSPTTVVLPAATYDTQLELYTNQSGRGMRWGAGSYTIKDLYFDPLSNTYTADGATNNPDIAITGDVSWDGAAAGSVAWNAGTGTVTFSGTSDQSIDFEDVGEIEDVVVDKASGRLTLDGKLESQSFTGDDGDFDANGQRIETTGNVTINGDTGFRFWDGSGPSMSNGRFDYDGDLWIYGPVALLKIKDLDFINTAGSSNYAFDVHVTDSIRTGTGWDIDATDPANVDNGGNIGWDFLGVTASSASSSELQSTSTSISSSSSLTSSATSSSSSTSTSPSSISATSQSSTRSWTSRSSTSQSGSSFSTLSSMTTSATSVSSSSTSLSSSSTQLSSLSSSSTSTQSSSSGSSSSSSSSSESSSSASTYGMFPDAASIVVTGLGLAGATVTKPT